MTTDENTHLVLIVTLDFSEIKVDYRGHDAWINSKKAALEIGRTGFFHRAGKELVGQFYPTHRINLITIRPMEEWEEEK